MIFLLEDTRQQNKKHDLKHKWFLDNGVVVNRETLRCGDYQLAGKGNVAVDSKNSIEELIGDVQAKTIPKRDVEASLKELVQPRYVSDLYHIITDDDSNRLVEAEITQYCYKNRIDDALISKIQTLYIKHKSFFHRGLIRSKMYGIKLYILVENKDGITSVNDLFKWVNPRSKYLVKTNQIVGTYVSSGRTKYKRVQKYPNCMSGEKLARACITMKLKYGVEFVFCTPEESGERIIELLKGN